MTTALALLPDLLVGVVRAGIGQSKVNPLVGALAGEEEGRGAMLRFRESTGVGSG